jgi:pSer/pThr/pTyr-binding forkhead associated (FHA) protein
MVYVIRDLASWRHTLVNGSIVEEQALRPGDKLQFGPKIVMELEIPTAEELEDLAGRVPVELAERVEFEPCQDESSPGTVDEEVAVAAEERSDPSEEDEEDLPHTSVWPIDSLLDAQSAIVGQAESIDPADGAPADPERAEGAVWSEQSQDEWNLDDGEPRQEEIALDRSEEEDFEFGADDESGPAEAWARLSHGDSDSWPSDEADGGSDAEALQSGDSSDERASDDDRETAAVGATPRPESSDPPEAQLWLKALANPSRIIRQQAQRTLKKLTGRHYDIE